ncbi:MAG TPA: site-specific DNA-methyltransferase [Pyrinomonadaceae bacterium]|jgi:adenine-specific DNA-methyltransferase
MAKNTRKRSAETLKRGGASRKNGPTAEDRSAVRREGQSPVRVAYERRNRDLDPQLVWRGKDGQDCSDLLVDAPPLYVQEEVQPKFLIDDLLRRTRAGGKTSGSPADLFADFKGPPDDDARTEFYRHEAQRANRMILGDSLQVMASLAEREGLRGRVQCVYIDPPYGIKFNSNFQWSTTSRDVKDGKVGHITREPEQVRAFRDTWRDGVHSYLTYLRDRLTVARDLLAESGSVFVQIGDENLHLVRGLLDEVFGPENFCSVIAFQKTTGANSPAAKTNVVPGVLDYVVWYARSFDSVKYRQPFSEKRLGEAGTTQYVWERRADLSDERIDPRTFRGDERAVFAADNLTSQTAGATTIYDFGHEGEVFRAGKGGWKTHAGGMERLARAGRLKPIGRSLMYRRFLHDFAVSPRNNLWTDVLMTGYTEDKTYVVQTSLKVVQRCVLMSTDPGDLVLDPTCGSGTTAYVAEQWGRRWITIDTSRVALALARARLMGARYPFYLLADSPEGRRREAELTRAVPSGRPTRGDIRQGFVYERVPHVTLKSVANNAEVDVIWEKFQASLEPLRERLNAALGRSWEEWQVPRDADAGWPPRAKRLHAEWWRGRVARQKEIDASVEANAEFEYLYDKPYEDRKRVRVAGPFTVESLSPHRVPAVDENDEPVDTASCPNAAGGAERDFVQMILGSLKAAGVQQAHREDKIDFTSLVPWPGDLICAEGRYAEGGEESGREKRAAVFVGPEFGTVSRPDLVAATREARDAGFDVLVACAFNYDAHSSEFDKLGRIPVLKARMNADLHMADDLKNTGKGNLFVIFGEPDIDIIDGGPEAKPGQLRIKLNGVDVFHPDTGEVRSDGAEGIACWFIDTDYNGESFFVRHAYFLGASDPYRALKTTLKAEIDEEAWATLHGDTSRPFDKPAGGRVAVKVINHLGDEVLKVFKAG